VTSSCDADRKTCSGPFTLPSVGGKLYVRSFSNPKVVKAGRDASQQVCVSSPSLTKTCVAPGATVTVSAVADGTWTMETDLLAGEAPAPAPKLSLTFGFDCR
jgi:hypothetical protein